MGLGIPDGGSAFRCLLCLCSFLDSHHLHLRFKGAVTSGGAGSVLVAASFSGFCIITVGDCDSGIVAVWVFAHYGGLASRVGCAIFIGSVTLWGGGPVVGTILVGCCG